MLRKYNKFRQGDKVRNFDVSLNLFLTHKQKSLESPYPYNISVMQQRFLLVSLGYLWFIIWENGIYIILKKKLNIYGILHGKCGRAEFTYEFLTYEKSRVSAAPSE